MPLGWIILTCLMSHQPTARPTPPGVVITYSPASSKVYLGSPSLVRLGDEYLVSHDEFGPGSSKDITHIFVSTDEGKTWQKRATMKGQWWSGLFIHRGVLYLMGTSKEYGHVVIRRSTDAGKTWTEPTDRVTGLLHADGKYHTSAMPVVEHQGRLWRAMEDAQGPGNWGSHFRSFMMSAPVDADLLKAESWTSSNRLGRDPTWLNNRMGGWLEGNAVLDRNGKMGIMLRVDFKDKQEKAAWIDISADGKEAKFDTATGFIDFPGGCKKFVIRYDPVSKMYWTLSNAVPTEFQGSNAAMTRNTLALLKSSDLRHWKQTRVLMQAPNIKKHGFQYVDWLFEGDDIVAVVRTAFDDTFDGAHNQHDSNYVLFTRVKGFRAK